jgi:hypothetical protein
MVSPDLLRERFDYDPITGVLIRKVKTGHNCKLGITGFLDQKGYRRIKIEGRSVLAHRAIWAWMTNKWPGLDIDHANGVPSDNRWSNLREATESQNSANGRMSVRNTTGKKGVCYDRKRRKFSAQIRVEGRLIFLGRYCNIEDAAGAYDQAAENFFGEFARGNEKRAVSCSVG